MQFNKSDNYPKKFINENMMGPNSLRILEEISNTISFTKDMRILDLGCGKALSSIFIAKEFGSEVFALDLWIDASENYERIKKMALEKSIIPLHCDVEKLPFAHNYFDVLLCIDAYHYFGRTPEYMDSHIAPFVKKGGDIIIVVPGVKEEFTTTPAEFLLSWSAEDVSTFRTCAWWQELFSQSKQVAIKEIYEMKSFEKAWEDWLNSGNEYAEGDKEAMNAGANNHMNLIAIILTKSI